MKKTFRLLLLFMALTAVSCSDSDDPTPDPPPAVKQDRTVIVYQNAQNSLGADNCHRQDSAEIVQGARYMGDGDRLLLYVDDGAAPRIYLVEKSTLAPVCVYRAESDWDSSSPATLQHVVEWCKDNYPADHYGLVLWSHADGWLPMIKKQRTFGIDVGADGSMTTDKGADGNYGSQMAIDDMAAALENSGVHFDYIFFDACLMQCIEVDYALRRTTDHIVAGPIVMPAIGANYSLLMQKGLFSDNPVDLAESYYTYMDGNAPYPYDDYGLVISVVKTEGLDSLARLTAETLRDFGGKYPDMADAQRYADYLSMYGYAPEYYDIDHAMRTVAVSDEAYGRWKAQLDRCVAGKFATPQVFSYYDRFYREVFLDIRTDDYAGVSAFVPQRRYTTSASSCRYGDLNEAFRQTQWYKDAGWEAKGW